MGKSSHNLSDLANIQQDDSLLVYLHGKLAKLTKTQIDIAEAAPGELPIEPMPKPSFELPTCSNPIRLRYDKLTVDDLVPPQC